MGKILVNFFSIRVLCVHLLLLLLPTEMQNSFLQTAQN